MSVAADRIAVYVVQVGPAARQLRNFGNQLRILGLYVPGEVADADVNTVFHRDVDRRRQQGRHGLVVAPGLHDRLWQH